MGFHVGNRRALFGGATAIQYFTTANAASLAPYEANATTGFVPVLAGTVITSDATVFHDGLYSIKYVTPGVDNYRMYFDLDTVLTAGIKYTLTMWYRHIGTGGEQTIKIGPVNSTSLGVTLASKVNNTETTFKRVVYRFVHSAETRYLVFQEDSVTHDGGLYIDAISITG